MLFFLIFMFSGNKCLSSAQSGSRMHSFLVSPYIFLPSVVTILYIYQYLHESGLKALHVSHWSYIPQIKNKTIERQRDMPPDEYSDLSNWELLCACTLGISMRRLQYLLLCLTFIITPYLHAGTSTTLWNIWIMICARS
jgi:hypothetical protein